jgi:hypothetical protein
MIIIAGEALAHSQHIFSAKTQELHSHNNVLTNATMMEPWRLKQLLLDVETNGGRKHAKLHTVCKANEIIYGIKGSDLRRSIQQKFGKLKANSARSYLSLLHAHSVSPSPNTLRDGMEDDGDEEEGDEEDSDEEEGDSYEEDNSSDMVGTAASLFEGLKLNNSSTNILTTSPSRTPPRTPPRTPLLVMKSPTAPYILPSVGNGTKRNPFVVTVDVHHPERNNGFDIQEVENIKFNDSLHRGFHIRKFIPIQDRAFWVATMASAPFLGCYPAISVKGPSQSCWERNSDRYFERIKINACEATLDAHKATVVAIGNSNGGDESMDDDRRFYSHWLLVFPRDVTLDNSIFSPGNTNILTAEVVGMEEKLFHGKKEHTHYGSVIFWRIGVKGKSKQLKAVATDVLPDLSDLFC